MEDKSITVCIAADGFPPQIGGIATFNQHLVSLLVNAGHKVILLSIDYHSNNNDSITTEGSFIKVQLRKTYYSHYKKWEPYFRPGGFNAPNWIATGTAMREWLLNNHNQYHIDIIEASDYGGCAIFLCDDHLPPVVITAHGSLLQFSRFRSVKKDDHYHVIKKLEALSFIHADAVIAHSAVNQTDLNAVFNREIKLATIPWQYKAPEKGVLDTVGKLVVIGGLQPEKGLYIMAEAMGLLRSKYPSIQLHWIGSDTFLAPGHLQMSEYLKNKYSALWQQNFIWRGKMDNEKTMNEIASAELIIIPSLFETFSYVALEAAQLKKPIIITKETGASSFFTHGTDAWIIPAGNPVALADAIMQLMQEPETRRLLGENAAKTIQQIFAPGKIVNERISIYKEVIKNRLTKSSGLHNSLSFLNTYRTSFRKYYYCIRQRIKKLIKRT